MQDHEELTAKLEAWTLEHRDLDDAIDNLSATSSFDQLKLRRLKKRKLALKDQIMQLQSNLLPDIIA